jgi:hypothetical protein
VAKIRVSVVKRGFRTLSSPHSSSRLTDGEVTSLGIQSLIAITPTPMRLAILSA